MVVFVIDIPIPVCLKEKIFQFALSSYQLSMQQLQNSISFSFYIYNNGLPKIIYFDTS